MKPEHPISSATFTRDQLYDTLIQTIALFFEYRDMHGHPEPKASQSAIQEILEGLDWMNDMAVQEKQDKEIYPDKDKFVNAQLEHVYCRMSYLEMQRFIYDAMKMYDSYLSYQGDNREAARKLTFAAISHKPMWMNEMLVAGIALNDMAMQNDLDRKEKDLSQNEIKGLKEMNDKLTDVLTRIAETANERNNIASFSISMARRLDRIAHLARTALEG